MRGEVVGVKSYAKARTGAGSTRMAAMAGVMSLGLIQPAWAADAVDVADAPEVAGVNVVASNRPLDTNTGLYVVRCFETGGVRI